MLKSTPATTVKNNNSCIKNINTTNNSPSNVKNIATALKTSPTCTKGVMSKNITTAPASKSPSTCTKNITQTPKGIIMNGDNTSNILNLPVISKSQTTIQKTTLPSSVKHAAANQATNSLVTANGTNSANGTHGHGIPAPPKVENAELRIIIIDENWSQYCYRIKINTPFGKLINRFCQQVRKIDHKSVLFWYHGRLVEDEDTPKTLNIKDGEVILAHYIK